MTPSRASMLMCSIPWSAHRMSRSLRGLGAQRHEHDFRRHADADWHDAAAESARNDHVASFAYMTVGESVAVTRWRDRRPAEQPDLAAVGVTAEHQRHALRHPH